MFQIFINILHYKIFKQELQSLSILLYMDSQFAKSGNFKSYVFLTSHTVNRNIVIICYEKIYISIKKNYSSLKMAGQLKHTDCHKVAF